MVWEKGVSGCVWFGSVWFWGLVWRGCGVGARGLDNCNSSFLLLIVIHRN